MFRNDDQHLPVRVKRNIAIPPLRPEYDRFLYAPIGESYDGMPFSVLSALARQNLDPWEEAAKLARLPRESAIERLASILHPETSASPPAAATAPAAVATAPAAEAASHVAGVTAPASAVPAPPAAATAERLLALLPSADRFSIPSFAATAKGEPRNIVPILIYLVVGAIILASALFGN